MVFHPDITRKDDVTLALNTASAAVRLASRQMTGNAGTVEIPNDDGTSTIMGSGAGVSGIAPWVGDTTAPGKPTGIGATSHNGYVSVSWDGTLEGGIPDDFKQVIVTLGYVDNDGDTQTLDLAPFTGRGEQVSGVLPAGAEVSVTAVAYDDAHAQDGSSAPNASASSDPVSVVVQSAIDPAVIQQAQDDAQEALDKYAQQADTLTVLQSQVDGNIATWFNSGEPSLDGYPVTSWTDDKDTHLGDLYYNTYTGYAYRFAKDDSDTYSWLRITDTDVVKALADAAKAQTTADGKNKVIASPTQPDSTGLTQGDLWFQLDAASHVVGIQVWDGSAFVDYVLMANEVLVAGSVGTVQIANGAVTADQITASEAMLAKLLVREIQADEIDVGSLAAAIVTSNLFKTSGTSDFTIINDTGVTVYKGGTPYAHMGSDAQYGMQVWNPVAGSLVDLSSLVFGTQMYSTSDDYRAVVTSSSGWGNWTFKSFSTTFVALTSRCLILSVWKAYLSSATSYGYMRMASSLIESNGTEHNATDGVQYIWPTINVGQPINGIGFLTDLVPGTTYTVRMQVRCSAEYGSGLTVHSYGQSMTIIPL